MNSDADGFGTEHILCYLDTRARTLWEARVRHGSGLGTSVQGDLEEAVAGAFVELRMVQEAPGLWGFYQDGKLFVSFDIHIPTTELNPVFLVQRFDSGPPVKLTIDEFWMNAP